jgi:non-specific protein-tyrosine kinase
VQTFIQLLKTSPVLDSASSQLGYEVQSSQIEAQQLKDTQVIILSVEDSHPDRVASIANILVNVLIEQNDYLQSSRYLASEESLTAQVDQVNKQIIDLQGQIDRLSTENVREQIVQVESKIAGLQSEIAILDNDIFYATNRGRNPDLAPTEWTARLAQLKSTLELYQEIYSNLLVLGKPTGTGSTDRLSHLQKTLDLYQQIYLQLLSGLEDVRLARLQNTPTIVQIEEAGIPSKPVRPLLFQNTLLGAAVGLMMVFGIVFAIEYFDGSLRSPTDVDHVLGLPVLGYITEIKPHGGEKTVHAFSHPRSLASEAFRNLRSSIDFSAQEHSLKTLLVTSSRPGEGKTTIASNLAAIFAQSGKHVILVDADLRRPAIHRVVGLPNRLGLTTLFRDSIRPEIVWKHVAGGLRGMHVITSGSLPENPAEILGSEKMLLILTELRQKADIIIFDGPPMMVADTRIIASLMDGVILVLQPGKSQADEAKSTLAQLKRSGANVLGAVFNRIPQNNTHYYEGYRYYSAGSYSGYQPQQKTAFQPTRLRIPALYEPATSPNGHHPAEIVN